MNRRSFLAASASAVAVGLAGCGSAQSKESWVKVDVVPEDQEIIESLQIVDRPTRFFGYDYTTVIELGTWTEGVLHEFHVVDEGETKHVIDLEEWSTDTGRGDLYFFPSPLEYEWTIQFLDRDEVFDQVVIWARRQGVIDDA